MTFSQKIGTYLAIPSSYAIGDNTDCMQVLYRMFSEHIVWNVISENTPCVWSLELSPIRFFCAPSIFSSGNVFYLFGSLPPCYFVGLEADVECMNEMCKKNWNSAADSRSRRLISTVGVKGLNHFNYVLPVRTNSQLSGWRSVGGDGAETACRVLIRRDVHINNILWQRESSGNAAFMSYQTHC